MATALRLPFAPDWPVVVGTVALGAALVLGLGLLGSWRALQARPAQLLRGE
jgi:putative ABC transport system permease protein